MLGRDLSWSDAVIVADAASAWRDGYSGDGGLGGDSCHRANKGSRQGLQFNLTTASQLQRQQESWLKNEENDYVKKLLQVTL